MKKSTLITTIAMIVVVVVALSTATYAWFSSQTTAVASTNFTTNASGDWSMMIGSIDRETGALTFSGTAVDSETLTPTEIQTGLWAPTAQIQTTIASSAASTSLSSRAGFVQASKTGNAHNITRLQTAAFNSAKEGGAGAEIGYVAPYAIRIMNVSGDNKRLQLNITLNAHDDGTTNSMYAAAAVRFYVYEITNADTNNTASYTSGYYSINETAAVNAATAISGTITQDSGIPMTTGLQGSYLGKDGDDDAILTRPVSIATYNVANIASEFPAAAGNNPNLGISTGDHVKTYSFDMQTYGVGGFSNIIIYAWIDGWVANGSAQSADFDVNFGFTSVPTLTANNG